MITLNKKYFNLVKSMVLYGIIFTEISYLLTDYLGFGYTISTYQTKIMVKLLCLTLINS